MKKTNDQNISQLNLTDAFKELEQLTAEFESGQVDLESGIPKFKRGLQLAKYLKGELGKIELEIEQIKEEFKDLEPDQVKPDGNL